MHHCRIFFGVTIALILFLFTGFMPCLATETDYIDNSAYNKPTQSKVKFIHDIHNENAGVDDCVGRVHVIRGCSCQLFCYCVGWSEFWQHWYVFAMRLHSALFNFIPPL